MGRRIDRKPDDVTELGGKTRPADADALGNPLRRVSIRLCQHDARPLHMFARPVAVGRDRRQLLALRGAQYHTYLLRHGPRPPKPWPSISYSRVFESSE